MSEREKLLLNVQKYRFTLFDISLFLDSHKNDEQAMAAYNKYSKEFMDARKAYVDKFGPLSHADMMGKNKWTWTDQPWPWEVEV
jgi:spore coat protein JB